MDKIEIDEIISLVESTIIRFCDFHKFKKLHPYENRFLLFDRDMLEMIVEFKIEADKLNLELSSLMISGIRPSTFYTIESLLSDKGILQRIAPRKITIEKSILYTVNTIELPTVKREELKTDLLLYLANELKHTNEIAHIFSIKIDKVFEIHDN